MPEHQFRTSRWHTAHKITRYCTNRI